MEPNDSDIDPKVDSINDSASYILVEDLLRTRRVMSFNIISSFVFLFFTLWTT